MTHDRGTAIRIELTFKDKDDVLFDPTTIKINYIRHLSTLSDAVSGIDITGNKVSTGLYFYIWQTTKTANLGTYIVEGEGTSGSYVAVERKYVEVVDVN